MSAHVVPKAKPFSEDDEENERTTIESGWEDEASTTVEEGEVADKIRSLADSAGPVPRRNGTNVTSSGAHQLDEPTVDDQHANSQIAALAPGLVGRLVITQGNDVGQEFDIRPGKSYTIGRAIDNDVVLTDIAVSRKHFDLRFQDEVWVIVDRGSGNGTVVNGNLEDNPFMLASGDLIEIGNTVFRFDQPDGVQRRPPSFGGPDDDEMSTVAGKAMRDDLLEPEPPPARAERPKTLPPPSPIRPRSPSAFPPLQAPPQPASTLPMPQMSGRAPMTAAPQSPTLLSAEPMVQPRSQPLPAMMPPTYQGPNVSPRPLLAGYPQFSDMPQQQVYGNGIMIAPNGHRNDASTAHVAPTPYGMNPSLAQPARAMPSGQLSRRAKMILGAGGLALLAGITTIAIIKSSSPQRAGAPGPGSATAKPVGKSDATPPDPPKQLTTTGTPPKQEPPKQVAIIMPPKQEPPKQEPPRQVVIIAPPKQEPPKKDPPKQDPPKKDPPRHVAKKDPPPHKDPPRQDPPRQDPPPHKDPPRRVAAMDTGEAKTKADELYRARKFNEASNVLAAAAKSADESEAKELRHIADLYVRVGRGLSAGTAPAAKPEEAFATLRAAENYDRPVGGAFSSDFETALAKVAPKAATAFMADKNYEQARSAVLEAEKLGASSTGTSMVKQALDRAAADLYAQASKEASSDPASAKDKCQRILSFTDSKSQWYQRAAKLKGSL